MKAGAGEKRVSDATAPRGRLRDYLEYLSNERRLSPHTTRNYARDVEALIELAGDIPLGRLETHQIRRFAAQLHARGLGGRTLARMLSSWRGYFNFLARHHRGAHNPCHGVRAPKSAKRLPHALSPEEAGRLMEIAGDDLLALRDRAMLELLYSSGLRLSELTGLAPPDVNQADATVRVTGKGGKTRIVPVGRYALAALAAWLAARERIPAVQPSALFVNRSGARLSQRAVQARVKRHGAKQGLASRVHPHALRHSFASHLLQSSGDLRAVQDMLGHASISTTQVYTQLDFQHLAKVYDAAHPRAKRKS
jgi:integrase/recombinase XerC